MSFATTLRGALELFGSFLMTCEDLQWTGASFAALHDPNVAPEYFAVEIWPGLPESEIERYASTWNVPLSSTHVDLLRQANGLRVGTLTIYGIPPSMLLSAPLLDRRTRQPLDVGAANQSWRIGYPSARRLFHLGSVKYSFQENAGLFQSNDGPVIAVLKAGAIVGTWRTYHELLNAGVSSVPRGA